MRQQVEEFDRFAEDVADVFVCYFPVKFRTKKSDGNAITGEMLAEALRCGDGRRERWKR